MCEAPREPRDPHPGWAHRLQVLRLCAQEAPDLVAADKLARRALDIIEQLVATPAHTLGGVHAQLELADRLLNTPGQRIGPADLAGRAVRAALQGLDELLTKEREA